MEKFDETLFNDLLRRYYSIVEQYPYRAAVWRTNSEPAQECAALLQELADQIERLLRESQLIEAPFEMRISKGVTNFPKNPWIGIFFKGEKPTNGIYPLFGLRNRYSFIACVKASRLDSVDWDSYRDLSRTFHEANRKDIEDVELLRDGNIALPAAVFRREDNISREALRHALRVSFDVYREIRANAPRQSARKDGTAQAVDEQALAVVNKRVDALTSSLDESEERQEKILARYQTGIEGADKLRTELAHLRQLIDDAKADAETGKKLVGTKLEESVKAVQDKLEKEFAVFVDASKATCADVERKYKSILERATVASLSDEFEKKRDAEKKVYESARNCFYWILLAFGVLGLAMVSLNYYQVGSSAADAFAYLRNLPRVGMFFMPIYLPLIWFVCHVNKKMNQSRRLMEEYSHKVVVAKTYIGLAEQAEGLINKGVASAKEAGSRLLHDAIAALCRNPNVVLDKVRTETPMSEAVDMFAKVAASVKKD